MATLIAMSIKTKINSTINKELMTTFGSARIDVDTLQERLAQIEKAMSIAVSYDDARAIALACADLWMPNPNRTGEMTYDSPEYNAVEIFCLCVRKAYNNA